MVRTLDKISKLAEEGRFDEITDEEMKVIEDFFDLMFNSLFEPMQKQISQLIEVFTPLSEFLEKVYSYKL